jgi:alkanesulfonate monooxygenase SsuD/methylene tetrahydromethanopterin reductase-like flavin-dependent oxidoreductase (luciferase family)
LIEAVRKAELAGIDSLWVSETPFSWDSYTILGTLAAVTSKASLGPGVTNPYIRHPHHLTMSAMTLDRISEGRSFLGIGRSVTGWYSGWLGLETGDPVTVMRNTLLRLRDLWKERNNVLKHQGFSLISQRSYPVEVRPRCPVYIAAVGPKMIDVAIELGDGLIFSWPTMEFLERTIPIVKASLARQGRDPGKFRFVVQTGFEVTTSKANVLENMKTKMSHIYRFEGIARAFWSNRYDVEKISLDLRKNYSGTMDIVNSTSNCNTDRLAQLETIRKIIPTNLVQEVGFIGRIDEIKKKLELYQIMGVTDMFVTPPQIDETAEDYELFVNQLNGKT